MFYLSISGKENRSTVSSLTYQTKANETVSLVKFPNANITQRKSIKQRKKTRCKQQTEEIKDKSMNMDQMRPLPGSFGRQE